jgi:hypothetical protein
LQSIGKHGFEAKPKNTTFWPSRTDMTADQTFRTPEDYSKAIHLVSHCGPTEFAPVLILLPVRQNQEQRLFDLDGPTALGTIEFGGLKPIKIRLPRCGRLGPGGQEIVWASLHGQNLWTSSIE